MFGSVVLDVAIALCLVFLLLSVLCSSMREGIEAWLNSRAVHLHRGIVELLNNGQTNLAQDLYSHPQVSCLFEGPYHPGVEKSRPQYKWRVTWFLQRLWSKMRQTSSASSSFADWAVRRTRLPAYVPARNFTSALVDIVVRGGVAQTTATSAAPLTVETVRQGAARLESRYLARAILGAFDAPGATLESGMANLEQWYNSSMERVTGWYKKETQLILFVLGLATAVLGNVDAIHIARTLYRDKPMREAVVQQATRVSADSSVLAANAKQTRASLDSLRLPIGWSGLDSTSVSAIWSKLRTLDFWRQLNVLQLLERVSGWFVTAIAVSFGAPFWFDLLGKFVQLRAATKPDEKSETGKSSPGTPGTSGGTAATSATAVTPSAPASSLVGTGVTAGSGAFVPHQWSTGPDPDGGVI